MKRGCRFRFTVSDCCEIYKGLTKLLDFHFVWVPLQGLPQIDFWKSDGGWNQSSQLPLEQWLDDTCDQESKQRMALLGNIVVPVQAGLGLSMLAEALRELARDPASDASQS